VPLATSLLLPRTGGQSSAAGRWSARSSAAIGGLQVVQDRLPSRHVVRVNDGVEMRRAGLGVTNQPPASAMVHAHCEVAVARHQPPLTTGASATCSASFASTWPRSSGESGGRSPRGRSPAPSRVESGGRHPHERRKPHIAGARARRSPHLPFSEPITMDRRNHTGDPTRAGTGQYGRVHPAVARARSLWGHGSRVITRQKADAVIQSCGTRRPGRTALDHCGNALRRVGLLRQVAGGAADPRHAGAAESARNARAILKAAQATGKRREFRRQEQQLHQKWLQGHSTRGGTADPALLPGNA